MRYLKCECGECERWDTGETVHECQGCSKCGTTFATHPEGHKPLGEHDWVPRFDPATGQPDKRMCQRCYAIERAPKEVAP
ncbi:hypothetical protein BH10PSE14_BH10PSE14_06960 [soil metagenome]